MFTLYHSTSREPLEFLFNQLYSRSNLYFDLHVSCVLCSSLVLIAEYSPFLEGQACDHFQQVSHLAWSWRIAAKHGNGSMQHRPKMLRELWEFRISWKDDLHDLYALETSGNYWQQWDVTNIVSVRWGWCLISPLLNPRGIYWTYVWLRHPGEQVVTFGQWPNMVIVKEEKNVSEKWEDIPCCFYFPRFGFSQSWQIWTTHP